MIYLESMRLVLAQLRRPIHRLRIYATNLADGLSSPSLAGRFTACASV